MDSVFLETTFAGSAADASAPCLEKQAGIISGESVWGLCVAVGQMRSGRFAEN